MKKKLLYVMSSMEAGGAQRLIADLLPLFTNIYEVDLVVFFRVYNDFEEKLEKAGIKIISLDIKKRFNPIIAFRIRKIIKRYDIVHVHLFPPLYWAAIANIGIGKKLVYTEHNTTNRRRGKWYIRPIEKLIYSRYHQIISVSSQTQYELTAWTNDNSSRYVTIYNGVDIKSFASVKASKIDPCLIMVARFAPAKDQVTIIRALPFIKKDVYVKFVGDGDSIDYCREIAEKLGVTDRVVFLGTRSDVAEQIASSYIGIQSSNWEGLCLTAIEIMACGKPVIATNVDGLKEIVSGAGLLFPVGDEKQLAEEVNKLFSDSHFYEEVATKCRNRANDYDIKIMADKYLALYNSLI